MSSFRSPYVFGLALILASVASAHAVVDVQAPVSTIEDAKIKALVQKVLNERTELGFPGSLGVQSVNGFVYLYGSVDTGLEKSVAQSIASQTPGVRGVVNSIEQNN